MKPKEQVQRKVEVLKHEFEEKQERLRRVRCNDNDKYCRFTADMLESRLDELSGAIRALKWVLGELE